MNDISDLPHTLNSNIAKIKKNEHQNSTKDSYALTQSNY